METHGDFGEARNVEHVLRKATRGEQSQIKRETMWATSGKAVEAGLSKPIGAHIMIVCCPGARYGSTGFNIWPGGFQFCFG
jgi:hypothetical protein